MDTHDSSLLCNLIPHQSEFLCKEDREKQKFRKKTISCHKLDPSKLEMARPMSGDFDGWSMKGAYRLLGWLCVSYAYQ